MSWVFWHAGLPLSASTSKGFAYTPRRRWVVFFDFPGPPDRISHVGIVEAARGPRDITTLEGNTNAKGSRTGGMVARLNRRSGIVGYGVPPFGAGGSAPPIGQEDDMFTDDDRNRLRGMDDRLRKVEQRLAKVEVTSEAGADDEANLTKLLDYLTKEGSGEERRNLRVIGEALGLVVNDDGELVHEPPEN